MCRVWGQGKKVIRVVSVISVLRSGRQIGVRIGTTNNNVPGDV